MYKGNKRGSVLKEVWWVVRIVREAKVVGVRVWIMTSKVFSETESNRLPKHQPWDMTIDFVENAPKIMDCKIYPLTLDEQEKMKEYIHTELEKKFIRHSKSPIASPLFFVGKKDGKQWLVIDYRKVNAITIPDLGPIPLLQEEIDKVKDARLFTKLDIQTVLCLVLFVCVWLSICVNSSPR